MKLPVVGGEGPFGIILCPSRELARQTFDVVNYFCQHLKQGGFPELRTVLCIGKALERQWSLRRGPASVQWLIVHTKPSLHINSEKFPSFREISQAVGVIMVRVRGSTSRMFQRFM